MMNKRIVTITQPEYELHYRHKMVSPTVPQQPARVDSSNKMYYVWQLCAIDMESWLKSKFGRRGNGWDMWVVERSHDSSTPAKVGIRFEHEEDAVLFHLLTS